MRPIRRGREASEHSALRSQGSAPLCYSSFLQHDSDRMAKKRIGLLTGGGDCPGLNAVIRAAVRTLIRDYDADVIGIQFGFEGLLTNATIPLSSESIRGILPKGGTLLRTTNRGNPFAYPSSGDCVDRSSEVVRNILTLTPTVIIPIGR